MKTLASYGNSFNEPIEGDNCLKKKPFLLPSSSIQFLDEFMSGKGGAINKTGEKDTSYRSSNLIQKIQRKNLFIEGLIRCTQANLNKFYEKDLVWNDIAKHLNRNSKFLF